ncbi:hypothetical protein BJ085DRAFT_39864 [Dimargaris cristalligena]|uniref:Uncharacterized protein n=1 Tax=Dimargaris cristalligena TaxID=215637 RepID=A0A4P9ZM56_9FUNG|nr:hypothetical protein BJ085DRAFT_39864 [Dimargaris cristalligena]|eukprot:RKP33702.1 hypothetical protein BJ085DRAFT_39864 [Dimargaris cristalligena]
MIILVNEKEHLSALLLRQLLSVHSIVDLHGAPSPETQATRMKEVAGAMEAESLEEALEEALLAAEDADTEDASSQGHGTSVHKFEIDNLEISPNLGVVHPEFAVCIAQALVGAQTSVATIEDPPTQAEEVKEATLFSFNEDPIQPIIVNQPVIHAGLNRQFTRILMNSGCNTFVVSDCFHAKHRFRNVRSSWRLQINLEARGKSSRYLHMTQADISMHNLATKINVGNKDKLEGPKPPQSFPITGSMQMKSSSFLKTWRCRMFDYVIQCMPVHSPNNPDVVDINLTQIATLEELLYPINVMPKARNESFTPFNY